MSLRCLKLSKDPHLTQNELQIPYSGSKALPGLNPHIEPAPPYLSNLPPNSPLTHQTQVTVLP